MGWTSTHATMRNKNGIDRKAECDLLFNWKEETETGVSGYEVLRSSMVGSTYYAALRSRKTAEVCAVVCLTHIDSKDYFDFSNKSMDETMGPNESKCPVSILKLLTPTDHEWASEWRKRCYEYAAKKKDSNQLSKLPLGSVIKIEGKVYEDGKWIDGVAHLTKCKINKYKNPVWVDWPRYVRWQTKRVEQSNYIVESIPSETEDNK